MRVGAFAVKQRAAELFLELLDGARQRGLSDVAALGRAGEVQFLAEAEEIADLMHFHKKSPGPVAMRLLVRCTDTRESRQGERRRRDARKSVKLV